jgi:exodeoxyribonuclease V gamma subunit
MNLGVEPANRKTERLMSLAEEGKEKVRKAFPRISFFGIYEYSKALLPLFLKLEEITDVTFYVHLLSPARDYTNDLLSFFGSKCRELAAFSGYPETVNETIKGNPATTLQKLQDNIRKNINSELVPDDSIIINSCYSPVREAECLYNYLLSHFEKDPALKPADVLVITPEIDKYSPFIKAVFRNAPVKIPFRILCASSGYEESISFAIQQLMEFHEEDLTSEKVISLLEQYRIKNRFGIRDAGYIRSVVKRANIRFGRENDKEDDTRYVSWKYGLEKIILGFAICGEEEFIPEGTGEDAYSLFPFMDTESSPAHDLFRLKAFLDRLEHMLDEMLKPRTLGEWKKFLIEDVMQRMVFLDDSEECDRSEVKAIYKALSFIDEVEYTDAVAFPVFLEEISHKLFGESRELKPGIGNVTVTTHLQAAGIPAKIVCFIGVNNGVFPAMDHTPDFNLLDEQCPARKNRRETDKYLFLLSVMSATDKFYASHIGRSIKDNTKIPASVALEVLTEIIGPGLRKTEHPLHGFSSMYNGMDPNLYTYLYHNDYREYRVKDKSCRDVAEVTVRDLVSFFQDPAASYFTSALGIRYDEYDSTLEETEIFETDNLQQWIIKSELLNDGGDIRKYIDKGIKEGRLPLKAAAEILVEDLNGELVLLRETLKQVIRNWEKSGVSIDSCIGGIRITGIIDGIYGDEFIYYTLSSYEPKHKVEAYIKSLLLFAAGAVSSALFVNREGCIAHIPFRSSQEAEASLKYLLGYYAEGCARPLLFTLSAAEKSLDENAGDEDLKKEIVKAAHPNWKSSMPPNEYILALERDGLLDRFGPEDSDKIREIAIQLAINQF